MLAPFSESPPQPLNQQGPPAISRSGGSQIIRARVSCCLCVTSQRLVRK